MMIILADVQENEEVLCPAVFETIAAIHDF